MSKVIPIQSVVKLNIIDCPRCRETPNARMLVDTYNNAKFSVIFCPKCGISTGYFPGFSLTAKAWNEQLVLDFIENEHLPKKEGKNDAGRPEIYHFP